LNGQAKIGKQDDQEEFRVRGHLRANPPVVFIPAEVNGQKDDQTENLPDEEAEDSQANESQKGVHAVLVLKTGGHAVFIEMYGDAGGQP
jgi:hypothetical protein